VKNSLLPERQLAILDFITQQIRAKGYPPSVREIGQAVGLYSSSTVHGHLRRLEEKGLIRRDPTKPRAIEVLIEKEHESAIAPKTIQIPLVGRVTAGKPILAVENIEDWFPLPADMVHPDSSFLLAVEGESMIGAGIIPGDFVIVRQQNTAHDGDIIVALIEDEATVKRFYKESDHVRLQPENPAMEPIRTRQVSILGKVVGLIRRYM